jgi:hypothetical protein
MEHEKEDHPIGNDPETLSRADRVKYEVSK